MVHNLWQEKIVHNPSGTVYGTSHDVSTWSSQSGLTKYGTEQTRSTYMDHGRQPPASPRNDTTQCGLTEYGIEQSRSTYSAARHRPASIAVTRNTARSSKKVSLTPLDKAKMQWARHKQRAKAETRDAPNRSSRSHETRMDIIGSRSSSLVDERNDVDDDDANAQMSETGCKVIFDDMKEGVAESFELMSESFEDATKESGLRDIVFMNKEGSAKPNSEEESSKMIQTDSFASPQKNLKTNRRLASFFCGGVGVDAFDRLCGPLTTESDNTDDTNSLTGNSSSSSSENQDLPLGNDGEDSNTMEEQNLLLRETFSVLSASHPDVGWKINVNKNNRRMVKRRPGSFGPTAKETYKVAILDNRTSGSTSTSIKIANVRRDPALLSRCHFAGWDGKRSHYIVLTAPLERETDASKGILGKLKEVPGKWTLMNLLSPSDTMPKEEIGRKLEGTDAVVHLVVGPEEPPIDGEESKGIASSDNTGDEEKALNKIMAGWGSNDPDEENDDEESYSPSTVGVVEDTLLRSFLGSESWTETEEPTDHPPQNPSNPTNVVDAKPPLSPVVNRLPLNHPRTNTATSRLSTGSSHRRSNPIFPSSDGKMSQIVDQMSSVQPEGATDQKQDTRIIPAEQGSTIKSQQPERCSSLLVNYKLDTKADKKFKRGNRKNRSDSEASRGTKSTLKSSAAEPLQRTSSVILKPSVSFEQVLVHSPQDFLVRCPMFRRALRSMGHCGKREVPRLEGWVAFRKGNGLQSFGPLRNFSRDDFRYIVLTNGRITNGTYLSGSPTLHVMTSKLDRSGISVDDIRNLGLAKNMMITSSATSNGSRCISIVDGRNEKVIGTFMPVLIKEALFTDVSKSCLVSESRFEKIMSRNDSADLSPVVLDGQQDAANHALFVLDCELKRNRTQK